MRKVISIENQETEFYKTTITKTQDDCYCMDYNWKENTNHQNCPCLEKFEKFRNESELNEFAAKREFEKIKDYGVCIECKGTNKRVFITRNKHFKYLCVNGPLAGKRYTTDDITDEYSLYNYSHGSKKDIYKAVWIYSDSLKG
jgi:hypothetical protein